VADFAHLFCDAPTGLMLLCEFILNTAPPGAIADEVRLQTKHSCFATRPQGWMWFEVLTCAFSLGW
jgi:hypothetical protein